ncbi:hypothetical protein AB0D49_08065 [Streptomyces sp. NPDC048290]|uniref:hypothetical protein n=1 Tax=Streptomyces sp. NPDC048290 TaxID=3155811 RepID=UPI0034147CAE
MSPAVWEWREGSGGAGYLQRVGADIEYTATQRAYLAYGDHVRDCPVCAVDGEVCVTADQLWEAYRAAKDPTAAP